MKFLARKSERIEPQVEEALLAERLKSVAGRGRNEMDLCPPRPDPAEPRRVKRLFWTPGELIQAGC